jgi:hypothetical protein
MTITLPRSRSDRTKRAMLSKQMGIIRECFATSRAAIARLARALLVIHDKELYLLTHKTFEEFCLDEFDISRSRGYQLLDFARVVGHLSANNCGHLALPQRESHARLLAILPPDQQIKAARLVQKTLKAEHRSKPVTADFIRSVQSLGGSDGDLLQGVADGERRATRYLKCEARLPQLPHNGQHRSSCPEPVYTAVQGNNADLIANVARLYLHPGDVICDVTVGQAVFWKKVDLTQYKFFGTDVALRPSVDLRKLRYKDGYADHLVLDPPYQHDGEDFTGAQYNARRTVRKMRHADIINDLYGGGLEEARRVLKPGGLCWVKCCDEIEAGKQRRSHIEIRQIAIGLGFEDVDLFILHRAAPPMLRQRRQIHARKNHSFLWIFRKPSKSPKQ